VVCWVESGSKPNGLCPFGVKNARGVSFSGGKRGGCGENIGGCGENVENSGEKCKFAGEKKLYHMAYHRKVLQRHMEQAIAAGALVGGKRKRPPDDEVVKLNDYKAAALLEGMDNFLRASMIRAGVLKAKIKGIVYRKKVYEQALHLYRSNVRKVLQKMSSKVLAAVALGATSGTLKAYHCMHSLEREISGNPSALPRATEVSEAVKLIWDKCNEDLDPAA
jgi:hypothetical protein